MIEYEFPLDEGRHIGKNESWWFGGYVTSNYGEGFFICALYVVRSNDERLIQAVSLKEIKTGRLYADLNECKLDSYAYDLNELNFHINSNDKWYTTGINPFAYRLITTISDKWSNVSLDISIKSVKGPTIQGTLGTINDNLKRTAYYDHTNCEVVGEVRIYNQVIPVQGTGYISREWGKRLGGNWQWSAIQLNNDFEICAAKFQNIDGVEDEAWIVNPEGNVKTSSDLDIIITNYSSTWWSEKWLLQSEEGEFNLTVQLMTELQSVIGLNEGVCSVEGIFKGDHVEGICFTEQTVRFLNNLD